MSDLHDKLKTNRQKAMTDWGQLNHQVVGGEVFPMADHEKIELLKAELERAKLINKRACDDWSHDDTKVKELLKPHLPGDDLESDGYSFRGVVAVAELAAARFTALENALREAKSWIAQVLDAHSRTMCEVTETGNSRGLSLTAQLHLNGLTALQTLSALNIK
jgi:hypothetical protein